MSTIVPIPNFEITDVPSGEELRAMRTGLNASIATTNEAIEELNDLEHPIRILAEEAAASAAASAGDASAANISAGAASGSASNAAQSAIDAGTARTGAELALTQTQAEKQAAETARQGSESAETASEAARDITLAARDVTTAARDVTVAARDETVAARDITLAARDVATGARDVAIAQTVIATSKAAEAASSAVDAATLYGQLLALPVTGQTSGTPTSATVRFSATEDLDVWTTGQATASVVYSDDTGSGFRLHTVTLNCPNNSSGVLVIGDAHKIRSFGNHRGADAPTVDFYTPTNINTSPILNINIANIPRLIQKITNGLNTSVGALLVASGSTTLPPGLTCFFWSEGRVSGAVYTITGAPPAALTRLRVLASMLQWDVSTLGSSTNPQNFSVLRLTNYRNPSSTLSATQLISLLTAIVNNTGTLPTPVDVAEYSDSPSIATIQSATPNVAGTEAEQIRYWINEILAKPGTTPRTFTLNTTAFTL